MIDTELQKGALAIEQTSDCNEIEEGLKSLSLKALAAQGQAMLNLMISEYRTSLGGRLAITISPDKAIGEFLPVFKIGDVLNVARQPKGINLAEAKRESFEAVVIRQGKDQITVAADSSIETKIGDYVDTRLWAYKTADVATYKRIAWALDKVPTFVGRAARFALCDRDVAPQIGTKTGLSMINPNLNSEQVAAISSAVGSELSVIHGPPGTGKTSTLVELTLQLLKCKEHVLICAPSNVAADNLIEKLAPHLVKPGSLVRIGHPARVNEQNRRYSLDYLAQESNGGLVIRELRSEIDELVRAGVKKKKNRDWGEVKVLRKELRNRESTLTNDLLRNAKVVVGTLHTAASKVMSAAANASSAQPLFNTIIIDEVSQATWSQSIVPFAAISGLERLVVAGDNYQLPPTIKTTDRDARKILEHTLFDALVDTYSSEIKHLLTEQYRMNSKIMNFPSDEFYEGRLRAAPSVADLVLTVDSSVAISEIMWIDTLGQMPESRAEDGSRSIVNVGEAELVKAHTLSILCSGIPPSSIGVISPYSAQVAVLRDSLPDSIECSTVDGFQGREMEAIIVSLVRSNPEGDIGFLSDKRRLNVAITRPKKHLCVVGDSETVASKDECYMDWYNYIVENGEVEYTDQ